MNVLCVGDVHIKVGNICDVDEMIQKLIDLCNTRKPNFIVLMGDILDKHSTINVHCLMRAETLVHSLSQISPVYLLVGNHDRPNNSNFLTNEHPFNAMKKWNNVYIVDTTIEYIIEINDHRYRYIFVPYVPPGRFQEALDKVENPLGKDVTAIFCHQEFLGAQMGAIISKEGDAWDVSSPKNFSGHIHDWAVLQENMTYVGTPIQHSYADRKDKTVSLIHFDGKNTLHERIDLGLKKKTIVYITPEEIAAYVPTDKEYVKLVVRGDEASIKAVTKLDKIQQLKKQGVKVVFKTIQTAEKTGTSTIVKMNYRDRLLTELKNDADSIYWFNTLFR